MNHQIQIIFPKNHFSNKKQCDKKRGKIIILKKT